MNGAILKAKNLTIGYHVDGNLQKALLSGLNFNVYQGDMICLMGPNGCGKTTLFRALSGLNKQLHGEITINDRLIDLYSPVEMASLVSVVLTDKIEVSDLTVKDIVTLGRYPYTNFWGQLSKKDKIKIEEAIKILNLELLADCFYEKLSDGQKQKVLIARALAQDTPILILDEPTTFLDIPKKMEIMQILKKISREKNVAVLFSSHDWDLVLETSTKVWLINENGELVDGMPEDLILKGVVGKCFSHNKFFFNQEIGCFKEKIHKGQGVYVYGISGKNRIWTIHALNKVGLEVYSELKENIPQVRVDHTCWVLNYNEKTYNCLSLEDLLNKLEVF